MKVILILLLWGSNSLGQNHQRLDQETLANIIYDNCKFTFNLASFKVYIEDTTLFMNCKIDTTKKCLIEIKHSYNMDESMHICIKYSSEVINKLVVQQKEISNPYILDGSFYNSMGVQSIQWNYNNGKLNFIEFKYSDRNDKVIFEYEGGVIRKFNFQRGTFGECITYADDFIRKFSGKVRTYGGQITKKYANVNVNGRLGGIFINGQSVTNLGNHAIVEIIYDGKTYVTDNFNRLMLKDDYIKFLEVDVLNPNTGLMETFTGEAAYKFFK